MANFDSKLLAEIVRNSNSGFLVQKSDGSIVSLTQGVSGTIIEPSRALKEMLFSGYQPGEAEELTKGLVLALGGKMKSGPRTGGAKRGRKPKADKV